MGFCFDVSIILDWIKQHPP